MTLQMIYLYISIFIYLLTYGSSGHWTQGLVLARQALYHLSHSTTSYIHLFMKLW
jgi:hypothetical protein